MRGAQRSVKNTAKNVSLIVLVVLLLTLCAANWLTGLNVAQMPADSLMRRAHDHLFGGAVGYELRSSGVAAAEPVQLALTVDGQLYGVQYNVTDMDAAVVAVRDLWAQVLTGDELVSAGADELNAALRAGDCAELRYHGAIPLGAVAGWMGGTWKDGSDIYVETLVYAAGVERLFVRTSDGALYAAAAKADKNVLESAQDAFRGMSCKFSGEAYAVYPETLLFDSEVLSLPLLSNEPIDLFSTQNGTGLEALLQAFGFTAYADFYTEQNDQVRVFVDNVSTLRVSAAGLLQYAASAENTAVHAYEEGEVGGQSALDAQMDCARLILDAALRVGETNAHASLYAAGQQNGQTTLVFLQMYGGVPVLGENDFATFTFEGGALVSATVRLQRFASQDTNRIVLPARQAAAGAMGEASGLMVAYRAQGDKGYVPARFYWKGND
ncbi:hypothetical protein [Candidatus Agathobaculum pullicola]|uniref:hypothetical protein n=1 Tax=Candidatus Agathobaculum pullicola TaxID=2838426 RepID=UPI003F8FDE31